MDCIVHGVAKSQIRLSDFYLLCIRNCQGLMMKSQRACPLGLSVLGNTQKQALRNYKYTHAGMGIHTRRHGYTHMSVKTVMSAREEIIGIEAETNGVREGSTSMRHTVVEEGHFR